MSANNSQPQMATVPMFANTDPNSDNQNAPFGAGAPANDREFARSFLALTQLRGLGMTSLHALVRHYPDLTVVWREEVSKLQEVLHNAKVPNSQVLAEQIHNHQPALLTEGRDLETYLEKRSIRLFSAFSHQYPRRLRDIPDAPGWLFVEGNAEVLNQGAFVAVVGTRKASTMGKRAAEQVTWLAAMSGLGLVSGLAEGIDAAAHTMANRHSVPQIAVLGTGINITFPTSTATVRRQIAASGGCVITEYLPNDNYGRSRFVQRNRIQAALSEAVCPVEGKAQSGTMHTVRFAQKYARYLFGVTRGSASLENEMPQVLRGLGAPVFDIEGMDGKADLSEFFRKLPGERFPTPERPDPEFMFRHVLKAIDSLVSYDELSSAEKEYLVREVQRRLGVLDN